MVNISWITIFTTLLLLYVTADLYEESGGKSTPKSYDTGKSRTSSEKSGEVTTTGNEQPLEKNNDDVEIDGDGSSTPKIDNGNGKVAFKFGGLMKKRENTTVENVLSEQGAEVNEAISRIGQDAVQSGRSMSLLNSEPGVNNLMEQSQLAETNEGNEGSGLLGGLLNLLSALLQ